MEIRVYYTHSKKKIFQGYQHKLLKPFKKWLYALKKQNEIYFTDKEKNENPLYRATTK